VHDRAVAEDLVQETFLRVWNRAESFDAGRGEMGSWILAVARNRAIDYLRSVGGRMAAGEVDLRALETASARPREEQALEVDRKRLLEGAFRRLTPNQKRVIRLAYYEGLSQSEMASRLKQPLGTVKSWVAAALRVMREELT
jgi:RNA polymerase sigma-70 factor (ECF subfamily)